MKTITRLLPLLWLALPAVSTADLPTADAPDTADFPGIKRYEGSVILSQEEQAYGRTRFQAAQIWGNANDPEQTREVEGAVHRTNYMLRNDGERRRTPLEVLRNYQNSLEDEGFRIHWQATEKREFGGIGPWLDGYLREEFYQWALTAGASEVCYLIAEKPGITLSLHVSELGRDIGGRVTSHFSATGDNITLPAGSLFMHLSIITTQPMDERMVFVEAEQMKTTISGEGFIDLYGIQFAFDSAEIEEESAPTLQEIVTLLTDNPDLKLMIVGHTDNVGAYDYNQRLSEQRAQAVVRYLTGNHGIAADRLSAHGVGYAAPVASNQTDEGRAKNRRVVLVEQ